MDDSNNPVNQHAIKESQDGPTSSKLIKIQIPQQNINIANQDVLDYSAPSTSSSTLNQNPRTTNRTPYGKINSPGTNNRKIRKIAGLSCLVTKPAPIPIQGPIYRPIEGSLILYEEPDPGRRYDAFARDKGIVPVVVDPKISSKLEEVQKEGLKFMFDNYTKQNGCILAHEQGTGKTFTTIALCHTLLEQKAGAVTKSEPAVRKIVIVTPKHMVTNWVEEFRIWLGSDFVDSKILYTKSKPVEDEPTVQLFVAPDSKQKILIMSYENMKKYHFNYFTTVNQETNLDYASENESDESDDDDENDNTDEEDVNADLDADNADPKFDLLICDEVHILKNKDSKVSRIHRRLKFRVKIGLTGTPVQNSLDELINLIDIVQPKLLLNETKMKNSVKFVNRYVKPFTRVNLEAKGYILNASEKILINQLKTIITPVLHIRSNNVMVDKHELIICTKLTPNQEELYKEVSNLVLDDKYLNKTKQFKKFPAVALIVLKSICHHPDLITNVVKKWTSVFSSVAEIIKRQRENSEDGEYHYCFDSSKIKLAFLIILALRDKYNLQVQQKIHGGQSDIDPVWERVVVVSYRTQVLDILEALLKSEDVGIPCNSYYGGTKSSDKLEWVKRFNDPKGDRIQVLLLSSKAGGTGLNLIGGNHLILFDPDWNPANDEQVMARIWRPGQTRKCFMYRLNCTGTVEEVQMNRQNNKLQVKELMTNPKVTDMDVLQEGPKAPFVYVSNTISTLHDAINCSKEGCTEITHRSDPLASHSQALTSAPDNNLLKGQSDQLGVDPAIPAEVEEELGLDELYESYSIDSDSDDESEVFVAERNANDLSALSKWDHYNFKRKDAIAQNPDLSLLRKIWFAADPEQLMGSPELSSDPTQEEVEQLKEKKDPRISFIFHKKTDAKNRVKVTDVGTAIDIMLTKMG